MHPSPRFRETDLDILLARMKAHPFALVTVNGETAPLAVHTPVIAEADAHGPLLRFHISAANPVAARLLSGAPALIVFSGPDAYISPDWYTGLTDQVPTWNYLSVEAEGTAIPLDKAEATRLLDDLSDLFERQLLPKPVWTRTKMTPGVFEALLNGIHAFEMRPLRLEGITKLGQNKNAEARAGVIDALEALPEGADIAAAMRAL